MSNNDEESPRKILLMGLDNSGKTSIVLSLQKDTNLLSYYSLKPTQGIEIINLTSDGQKFAIWDLGGQEKYRIEYLENLERYTRGVDKLIFVIDIQDQDRYDLALEYLKKVIEYLESKDRTPKISVFLHKMDPQIEKENKIPIETLTELNKKILAIVSDNFKPDIFKTTIYTIFQKTII